MLRNSGQPLVEEELQDVVVGADEEAPTPEVEALVPHRLYQADELPLVSRQLAMASSERAAEEGQGPLPLVEHGAEARARGVTVDDELPAKVRHLEHWSRRQRPLERREGLHRLWRPSKGLLTEEARERGSVGAEVANELAVVPRKAQEAMNASCRPRLRPGGDRLHLVAIHGDAIGGDDVAQIGHRALAKGALGALDVEAMSSEGIEDEEDVLQVLSPRRTVDQDVIKENKHKKT
jgi:hypothetical protein